ncbi:hypothetical protein [Ramlibacter sp.]|uniref:WD40/YVTN/BNR-like repeat-containing protein n=1 Tax=Ramlibacter sp. TaxID=1917967 RepID=UPI002BF013AE|nr:hypothetical protein [Ramlibacter sp.]HWI83639.1 hypothetical protein [Ramlibacter sp.]
MISDQRVPAPAKWHRREFLFAVAALTGCGGGGGGVAEGGGPAGSPGGSGDSGLLAPGTTFFDLQFVDVQTAYGVGKQGLVARTDNGGQTWRRLPVDSTANLTSVLPVNRQLVIVSSDDEAVLRTVDGGSSWQPMRQGYGAPVDTARVAFAPDANRVALRVTGNVRWGGVDHLKITTNGGLDWLTTRPPYSQIPWALQFTRSGLLFDLKWPVSGDAVVLWVSDDFGRSYRQVPLSGVACGTFGEQGIWVQTSPGGAGSPATIALSQDGFLTWTALQMQVDGLAADAQPSIELRALDEAGRGWAISYAADSGTRGLLHSNDGGRHWTAVAAPEVPRVWNGRPLDGLGWVTMGDSGMFTNNVAEWFTTDAGAGWRRLDAAPADGTAVFMRRDAAGGLLTMVGSRQEGYTWRRSTDDGRTWRTLL